MLKRTISVGLVLIMALVMAAPLLHIDCDMPCCEVKEQACCELKAAPAESKGCEMRMKKCDHAQFIPMVSGPKSTPISKDLDQAKPTCVIKPNNPECKRVTNTALLHHPPEPPPKFITPLLL